MLKSLKIENFRAFQSFELQQLGRINLLVGENNSGKTSILEAIQLLYSPSDFEALSQMMEERGEITRTEDFWKKSSSELRICHLFYGHIVDIQSKFTILGQNNSDHNRLTAAIKSHEKISEKQAMLIGLEEENIIGTFDFVMDWDIENRNAESHFPLSPNNGLPIKYLHRTQRSFKEPLISPLFISSSSLNVEQMIGLFDQIVLSSDEDVIIHALQTIDPAIDRIAAVGYQGYLADGRSGFVIRRSDVNQRIPIGSMGDGIWRMLGLSLAAVCTKGGVLLVDEIDTGLHFTTMTNMWRMLWDITNRSDVQVFATTHSRDCWESLAELIEAEKIAENEIFIHRIEKGKSKSVLFDADQIVIAAERGIEVR